MCIQGVLWITISGDPKDYILQAGENHFLDGRGRVVVSSIGQSEFSVVRPDSLPAARIFQIAASADC